MADESLSSSEAEGEEEEEEDGQGNVQRERERETRDSRGRRRGQKEENRRLGSRKKLEGLFVLSEERLASCRLFIYMGDPTVIFLQSVSSLPRGNPQLQNSMYRSVDSI